MAEIALYNNHWSTLGGGEVSSGLLAETLNQRHQVTLLGPTPPDINAYKQFFNIDLASCSFKKTTTDLAVSKMSAEFEHLINHSYSSRAVNRTARGTYIVMFPGNPPRLRSRFKSSLFHPLWAGSKTIDAFLSEPSLRTESLRLKTNEKSWQNSYQRFFAISSYTSSWTEKLWKVKCELMHPPPAREVTPGSKNKTILSVGRFFNSKNTHAKRQLSLVQAFKALHPILHSPDWRLVLVGGCKPEDQDYFNYVKTEAEGFPIDVLCNLSGHELDEAYSSASFYWHATGLGESVTRHPARFEHFGISIVEAMSAGAVPLVLKIGGPAEIVRPSVDGIQWSTLDQLVSETKNLIENPDRAHLLRQNSLERSNVFSRQIHTQQVHKNFP